MRASLLQLSHHSFSMPEKTKIKPVTPPEIKPVEFSLEEREARNNDIQVMSQMRMDRDRPHPELDGMTYIQYYESNRKKDLSFLPPKKNPQDVRISSGLTREKDTTLLSTMLGMNFVPNVTAFDKDDMMVQELGDNMSDLVKKSREIENWQKKRPTIYREMISQGDVFVQEIYTEDFREMPLSEVEWNPDSDKISDFSFQSRLTKLFSGCAARMVSGKKIYMSSVRTEYVEDQDAVAVLNVYGRAKAYSRYANWERWENIPTTIDTLEFWGDGTTYKSWNLVPLGDQNQVAEVMLFNVKRNRFQIYLNGIPMLPHNFPMTAMFPSGELPLTQGKLEGISDFAYSKSQPSKVKIDQEVLDESTKLMIEGMRQGRKPPMGSRGKKVYSPNIFIAGKITPDMQAQDVFPLWQNAGLTQSDFQFYNLIKQGLEDKTVNKTYEGDSQDTSTLGQAQQDKQQQMLKLGLALDGVVNLERRMTWLRIYNIVENETKKYDPLVDKVNEGITGSYKKFNVNTTLEDGQKGIKMFRLQTDPFPPLADHAKEEHALSKQHGQEVRIVYMNPEVLRALKLQWFIIIQPTPQSNDMLSQLMFVQNLQTAIEIFGPDSLNQEYVKQRFAILINEDYNKFFKKMDITQMLQMGMNDPAVQNAIGNGAGGERRPAVQARANNNNKQVLAPVVR